LSIEPVDTDLSVAAISAGKVEHVLGEVEGVAHVIVDAIGERFESKRLVAFVIPTAGAVPADADPNVIRQVRELREQRRAFKVERHGLRRLDSSARRVDFAGSFNDRPIKRRSARRFAALPASFDDLAFILSHLRCTETGSGYKYLYPSAGGLYPVQAYLYVEPERVAGLEGGLYYVDPGGSLVMLSTELISTPDLHAPNNRNLASAAAFTVMMFGHLPAIAPQYGPLARDFCLLEAGYAAQVLMEAAVQTGCEMCPIGVMAVEPIVAKASLQSDDIFLHALVGGVRSDLPDEAEADALVAEQSVSGPKLIERLRAQAARCLPPYMYPQDIIILDKLPLAANGKVDRAPLRKIATAQIHDTMKAEDSCTDAEQRLTEIVMPLLGLSAVDVNREFFALGADSVKLVAFAAAIEREFGRHIKLADAFQYPTIRKMAAFLNASSTPPTDDPAITKARQRSLSRRHARRHGNGENDNG
jgi:SagB-type dehydrogenase family enzyme